MTIVRIFFSCAPFLVCLFWFFAFALQYRKNEKPKRMLTWFLATCTILYLCHALYLNGGLSTGMESLWTLCSLSVYPLYYIYIRELTACPPSGKQMALWLLPGAIVALAKYIVPSEGPEMIRKILFTSQVVMVCGTGYGALTAFDKKLADIYADMEGKETKDVKILLMAFVGTSVLSAIANSIGKQYFTTNDWLVLALLPFAIMLFALSYIGFTRNFSVYQYQNDANEEEEKIPETVETTEEENKLEQKIEMLMTEKHIYLMKNLKIGDMAKEAGSCRTYVSNYINNKYGYTFLEYINRHRIEYAKDLIRMGGQEKMWMVADKAGFSSEQSFYRNFQKFVGMSPTEWLEKEAGRVAK